MAIGAGDLRERVTIRRQQNVKNAATGGLTRGWADLATVWAKVRSIDGREALIGNVLLGVSHFEITIRFRDDIKASDQVLWRGRELNVHSAEDKAGTRIWLTLIVSTQAPQGAGS